MGSDKSCLRCGYPLRGARARWRYCSLTPVPSPAPAGPEALERRRSNDYDAGPGIEGAVRVVEG